MQQGIHLYEYVGDWEKYNETSLPEKENFYSHLNTQDITDADYEHAKVGSIKTCMFKVIHYCWLMH